MSNPKLTLEPILLSKAIKNLHLLFSNKIIKNKENKYLLNENHINNPKNTIEQIIFSGALIIELLKNDLRFLKNSDEIEYNTIECIIRIISDNENFDDCYNDISSSHNFYHLRFYQYINLLSKFNSNDESDVYKEIFNLLYFNPMKSGLLFSDARTVPDYQLEYLLKTLLNGAIQAFSEDFLEMIKLNEAELTEMINTL
jgi:hypothetical protein